MIKKGLSPRLAEVGKIKIGGKGALKKSKNNVEFRLPVRYDHFVVTTTEKGADGNFIIDGTIMQELEKDPKEIPIRLIFDDIDMNFYTSYQYYKGKKMICKGDGETAIYYGNKDGVPKSGPCNPDICPHAQEDSKGAVKCKISGILSCMLPFIMDIGGVYRFRTHGWNSVSNILASLQFISENTGGVLQGLPLKLKMLKKSTEDHGNVNTVTIVLDGIQMVKMRELAFQEFQNRKMLGINMKMLENKAVASGFLEDKDDPADVEEEFYAPMDDVTPPAPEADDKGGKTSEEVKDQIESKDAEQTEPTDETGPGLF